MDIKEYIKTKDGIDTVNRQAIFCLGSQLWQSYKGVSYMVHDKSLTMDEMERVEDKDSSMRDVWLERNRRLEGRFSRKNREFDERRALLRTERNKIRESMQMDKGLGLATNPEDVSEISRIDGRMKNLVDSGREMEIKRIEVQQRISSIDTDEKTEEMRAEDDAVAATKRALANAKPEDAHIAPIPGKCDWPDCGAEQPRESISKGVGPERWLKSHRVGKHINPAQRAAKKAEALAASEMQQETASAEVQAGVA